MLLSGFCLMSIPVKVKFRDFLDPNGYLASSLAICWLKYWSPPWIPSSTWIPSIPDKFWFLGFRSTNTQGSRGHGVKPNWANSSCSVWNQRYGASMSPKADLSSLPISPGWSCIALDNSTTGSKPMTLSFWGFPCKIRTRLWCQTILETNPWMR